VRTALAGALTGGPGTAGDNAVQQWRADGPRLDHRGARRILRYHNALRVLNTRRGQLSGPAVAELDQVLAAANEEALRLAGQVTEKTAPDPAQRVRRTEPRIALPGATRELVTSVWLGLESIQAAVANRVRTEVALPAYSGRDTGHLVARRADLESAQLRHAVRCALGMLLALSISMLWASSPLRLSFLLAVFAIMQPQLQDSIRVARQRAYGSVAGGGGARPADRARGPAAVRAGADRHRGDADRDVVLHAEEPAGVHACTVLMSVGLNVNMRPGDPRHAAGVPRPDALAVGIALVFGFVAVPGVPKPTVATRFNDAVATPASWCTRWPPR